AYASAKSIPYVAIVGEDELNTSTITLKDMTSGTQEKLTVERFFEKMLKMLSKD
ncbi:MAG: His/Gly/Thr/Pro-type tRNA ligase C-terminal domain-containing protein, partial [Bacteroidales bacterium]